MRRCAWLRAVAWARSQSNCRNAAIRSCPACSKSSSPQAREGSVPRSTRSRSGCRPARCSSTLPPRRSRPASLVGKNWSLPTGTGRRRLQIALAPLGGALSPPGAWPPRSGSTQPASPSPLTLAPLQPFNTPSPAGTGSWARELPVAEKAAADTGSAARVRIRLRSRLVGVDAPSDFAAYGSSIREVFQSYKAGVPIDDAVALGRAALDSRHVEPGGADHRVPPAVFYRGR